LSRKISEYYYSRRRCRHSDEN